MRLGSLDPAHHEPTALALPDGSELVVEPLVRNARPPGPEGLRPLHHPAQQRPGGRRARACWKTCTSSTCCRRCMPAGRCGASRSHFQSYEEVAKKFAKLLGMDPWLINPMYAQCGEVDFASASGPGVRADASRRPADQGAPQVQGIRHQREALRRGQGRQRHLRPGHHDGARRQGARRPEPAQRAQQAGRRPGRPGTSPRSSSRKACPPTSASTTPWPSRWST